MDTTAPLPPYLNPQLPAGTEIGHYRVEQLISTGGFGAVYRVSRDGQNFALKLPLAGAATQSTEERTAAETRITREVVSLMTLNHPNIVKVHGFDRWPEPTTGALYLVMDFVEGVPLLEWRRNELPTLREVVELFQSLAFALDAMHRLGVVHRDIKSANVLVAHQTRERWAANWKATLVDFGLARPAFTTNVTREHVLVGTEGLWAPEQILAALQPSPPAEPPQPHPEHEHSFFPLSMSPPPGFRFTPASDLHALGLLFYQALTGRRALLSMSEDLGGLLRELPRAPSIVAPGIPPGLDAPVLRLLARNPADRTPSGAELAAELEALLDSTHESWDCALPPASPQPPARAGAPTTPQRPDRVAPTQTSATTSEATTAKFEAKTADVIPEPLPMNTAAPGPAAAPSPRTRSQPTEPAPRLLVLSVAGFAALLVGGAAGLAAGGRLPALSAAVTSITTTSITPTLAAPTTAPTQLAALASPPPSLPGTAPALGPAPKTAPAPPSLLRAAPSLSTGTNPTARHRTAQPLLVRAVLTGPASPGGIHATLRQPAVLNGASLSTGTTLDGTADPLPDGRYLLRFDSVRRADGSELRLVANAVVDASAATRRPLTPGATPSGFEFDLSLEASP